MNELSPYISKPLSPVQAQQARIPNPARSEDFAAGLWALWYVLHRRRASIFLFFVGAVGLVTSGSFLVTPTYTAETTLLIEQKAPQVIDVQQVLPGPVSSYGHDYYETQYALLKSRSLAAQVIREQGLETHPLFREDEETAIEPVSHNATDVMPDVAPRLLETYIEDLLDIDLIGKTHLVKIAFETPDPVLSARLANAHADAYIRQGLKLRTQASKEAQQFLEKKLVELRERVEDSEVAVNRYRRDNALVSLDETNNIVVERLADLNRRLTAAESERINFEAQVRLIQKQAYDALPAVVNNPLIHVLRGQLVRLEGEYAHLTSQFRSGYPRVAQLKTQVEEVRRRLQREVQRIKQSIESAYLTAESEEIALRTAMEEQKRAALALKDAAVEYAILAREADTNRQLYDSVLQRMKEIGVAVGLRASNVTVIDKAITPAKHSKPKRGLLILVGAALGLIGGIGFAFCREYLDETFRNPEEAEAYLDLPILATVPDIASLDAPPVQAKAQSLQHQTTPLPGSASQPLLSAQSRFIVTEAYRTLCAGIFLFGENAACQTLLFTSSQQGEGKTTTMINTAWACAQMGSKVLVIDADLRRPTCHTIIKSTAQVGLVEVLCGQAELHAAVQAGPSSGFDFLPAGAVTSNPAKLIGSRKMHDVLMRLRTHYEYIFIDTPPVLPVSDAVRLAPMTDGVVFVVNGQRTLKRLTRVAQSRLNQAQVQVVGIAFNQMDVRSQEYPENTYTSYTVDPPFGSGAS